MVTLGGYEERPKRIFEVSTMSPGETIEALIESPFYLTLPTDQRKKIYDEMNAPFDPSLREKIVTSY
jgi:hypothetical protein